VAVTDMADGHKHTYSGGQNRSVTSSGPNGHIHIVPAAPWTMTEWSDGHQHWLPERIPTDVTLPVGMEPPGDPAY
jgi:hypothetical protein